MFGPVERQLRARGVSVLCVVAKLRAFASLVPLRVVFEFGLLGCCSSNRYPLGQADLETAMSAMVASDTNLAFDEVLATTEALLHQRLCADVGLPGSAGPEPAPPMAERPAAPPVPTSSACVPFSRAGARRCGKLPWPSGPLIRRTAKP
eukprot:13709279-Alexandrium_andersonii.AAC.1